MKRLIVGVSGASGAPLAEKLLRELQKHRDVETHLVITDGGERTIEQECTISAAEFKRLADVCHDNRNIGGTIASGSYETFGMIVLPCSMKTLAGMAHGYSDNLLLRAADVCLKEQRKLLIVPRESPLSKIHLDNMAYLASMPGVQIVPPMLGYYQQPRSLETMEEQFIGRILRFFGIQVGLLKEWHG